MAESWDMDILQTRNPEKTRSGEFRFETVYGKKLQKPLVRVLWQNRDTCSFRKR